MSTSALSSQRWRRLIPLAFVTYSLAVRGSLQLFVGRGWRPYAFAAYHLEPGGFARWPALASISGASLDPLAGPGHVSALHSGRWKTH